MAHKKIDKNTRIMIGTVGGLILGVGSLFYVLDQKGMLKPRYQNAQPAETIDNIADHDEHRLMDDTKTFSNRGYPFDEDDT